MSIDDWIRYWVAEKRLLELPVPAVFRAPKVRRMVISESIGKLLDGPWETDEWAERCGLLHGDLVQFVTGKRLQIARQPYKGKSAYMLRLVPDADEVWEIRCRDPEQIRVFGRFVRKDYFVALMWEFRSELKEAHEIIQRHRPLIPEDFPDVWREARLQCKTEWNNLFSAENPFSGAYFHDYLSNAVFV